MHHEDGRCATTAETVVVQGANLQAAIDAAVAGDKKLVVVGADSNGAAVTLTGKLSIVGKGPVRPSVVGGLATGLRVTGGEIYLRNLFVTSSAGGISLYRTSFHIEDSDVSMNRSGTFSPTEPFAWGGIFVRDPKTPHLLRDVKVVGNSDKGVVCNGKITLERVTATSNLTGDIGDLCK